MLQETNRLHKWTAIAAATLLCLTAFINLYNHFQYTRFSNLWYTCYVLMPIALNVILAVFLFCRKKSTALGCVFICQIVYPILIAPLFYILWMATDEFIVRYQGWPWLNMVSTLIGSANLLLMALDCFLAPRQSLRQIRTLFLILPALTAVFYVINSISSYMEAGLILDTLSIPALVVSFVTSCAPSILTGLSFFLSYDRKPAPAEPVQQ